MIIELGSSHITKPGDNIFLDLGFGKEEAAQLLAKSHALINQKIALKEDLMEQIVVWMKTQKLKQEQAAQILMITRPRLSDVVQRKTMKFTIDSLLDMVARTGKTVSFRFE